jgi:hypothetical protein
MNTATTTTTITLDEGFLSRRGWFDWLFALLAVAGGLYAFSMYHQHMDVYEKGILFAAVPAAIWLGWFWRPLRVLMLVVAGRRCWASCPYQGRSPGPTTSSGSSTSFPASRPSCG